MTDFARLVLAADTTQLKQAQTELGKVTVAGGKTEERIRGVDGRFIKLGESANQASRPLRESASAMDSVRSLAISAARGLAAMAAGYATIQAAGAAVTMARGFNAAISETSTLIEGTPEQLEMLSESARALAVAYGTDAQSQVKAFYQAISAGAGGVEEAAALLDTANRLAIGGVTDVTTAVDALTTAVNAYGPDVLSAAQASDAMFVAMRAGKTTIGELSGSLGQIVPIASAAGVSFDEVTAGIAALTTQGLSTSMATTGLRQVLASIIAPTKGATDAAAALGLSFDVQALKAKGLEGFLNDVMTATGGNEAVMAELFGSVEALGAALAFAGGAGETFSQIMADMGEKAGATDAAYQKMAASLDERWNRATAAAQNLALSLGNALLAVVVPAMEAAAAAGVFVAQNMDAIGIVLAGLASTQIPAIIAAIATMVGGMSLATTGATIMTGAVAGLRLALIALGGPIGIVFGLLGAAAAAFFAFRDNAGEAEDAAYDAAAGTAALMGELDAFVAGEPKASAAVIALANNNVKLASSAFEAARAELAKRRAMVESFAAIEAQRGNIATDDPESALLLGESEARMNRAAMALKDLRIQEQALAQAMRDREVAAREVGAATAKTVPPVEAAGDALDVITKKLKDAGGSGGAASQAAEGLTDAEKALKALENQSQQTAEFGDMVAGIVTGAGSIGDVFKQLGQQLLSSGISGIASSLFKGSGISEIFAGFFDTGGMIPAGQFGIAAEKRDEFVNGTLVRGPARVTSGADTARMMQGGASAATKLDVTVTMDQSTGALGAYVRDQAGRVVASSTPQIVKKSVKATYQQAREIPIGQRR